MVRVFGGQFAASLSTVAMRDECSDRFPQPNVHTRDGSGCQAIYESGVDGSQSGGDDPMRPGAF